MLREENYPLKEEPKLMAALLDPEQKPQSSLALVICKA